MKNGGTDQKVHANQRSRGWRKFLIFSGSLLLIFGVVLFRSAFQPRYEGKTVGYWVERACDEHATDFTDAEDAIREIGKPAVPYIVARLRLKDTPMRQRWADWRENLPDWLLKYFPPPRDIWWQHQQAASLLGEIGPGAKDALPELLNALDEDDEVHMIQRNVLQALGSIGPEARSAIPKLKFNFAQKTPLVRIWIADAVWKIDHETNFVLKTCEEALKLSMVTVDTNALPPVTYDEEALYAMAAEDILKEMGNTAKPIAPLLVQRLSRKINGADMPVPDFGRSGAESPTAGDLAQGHAALALAQIGLKNDPVIAALKNGLEQTNAYVSYCSGVALWKLDGRYACLAAPAIVQFVC